MQVTKEQTANGVLVVEFSEQIDSGTAQSFLKDFADKSGKIVIDVSDLAVPATSKNLFIGLVMEIIRTNPKANVRFYAPQDDMYKWCSIAVTHSTNVFWDRQLAFDFS